MAGSKRPHSPTSPAASTRKRRPVAAAAAAPPSPSSSVIESFDSKDRQKTPEATVPRRGYGAAEVPSSSTPKKRQGLRSANAIDAYPTPAKTPANRKSKLAQKALAPSKIVEVSDDDKDDIEEEEEEDEVALAAARRAARTVATNNTKVAVGPQKLNPKDRKWNQAWKDAQEKMGSMDPIHATGQNHIDHILRVFDLSYEYGPCIGMTRLERWNRAQNLGLDPPAEIRDMLLTVEGSNDERYRETTFSKFKELTKL